MKIALLGDIAFIGKYDITKNIFAKDRLRLMSEKLAEFDYVVANLEAPLTEDNRTLICKSMHLRTSILNIEMLKFLGVDAVSLANNHLFDYGINGLNETIAILEKNNIEWFGANSKYLIKDICGERICFSGFCCYSTNGSGYISGNRRNGINTLTYDNVIQQMDIDNQNKAFSIISFHWGDEHTNYPRYEHIRLAEILAKRNSCVIFGHHPHMIQGVQEISKSLVAYSLGNFIFDNCTSINGKFTVKQNLENKVSFILEVMIKTGSINRHICHGFRDEEDGLVFFDINRRINQISKTLERIENINEYDVMRKKQIKKVALDKFGKRNLRWFISRMNYYSIGARIIAAILKKKYNSEMVKFLGDRR